MKFTLTIDCDNAAFHHEEDDAFEPVPEIVEILNRVRSRLEQDYMDDTVIDRRRVLDTYGNTVGYYEMVDSP
jgi:hypothetical protein